MEVRGEGLDRTLTRLALLFLLLRLVCAAVLVPPWAGFDEPYHHGYVQESASRPQWPRFGEILLPERLVREVRKWPLPDAYARDFAGRGYGETVLPPEYAFRGANYETQQSPLYYFMAGRMLAFLPPLSPTGELYGLRLANAFCAFLVALLIAFAARVVGFGERAWMPVAFVAFVPGYALALSRVGNDAFCALLIAAAVALSLPGAGKGFKGEFLASLAAGLAPWAKLYGVVVLPSVVWRSLRARHGARRWILLTLCIVPPLLLAFFSWRVHGHLLPLQENLRSTASAGLLEVPWARAAWTVAKTHVWFSGMSFLVFPTWLYLIPVLLLLLGFALTLASLKDAEPSVRERFVLLLLPLALFWAALAYHAWRVFSSARAPGGTGGWYLWAAALPEALLVLRGLAVSNRWRSLAFAMFGLFLLLSVLGDLILFASSIGRVRTEGAGHVVGFLFANPEEGIGSFWTTRPAAAAVASVVSAILSWGVGIALILRGRKIETTR